MGDETTSGSDITIHVAATPIGNEQRCARCSKVLKRLGDDASPPSETNAPNQPKSVQQRWFMAFVVEEAGKPLYTSDKDQVNGGTLCKVANLP